MKKLKKLSLTVLFVVISVFFARLVMLANKSKDYRPITGIINGKLYPCSEKPNCVNSFASDSSSHYISPLNIEISLSDLKNTLSNSELNFNLLTESESYLHFSANSRLLNFVDDFEVLKIGDTLFFKSSSRVGYSDLGANRKRVERVKEILVNNN